MREKQFSFADNSCEVEREIEESNMVRRRKILIESLNTFFLFAFRLNLQVFAKRFFV